MLDHYMTDKELAERLSLSRNSVRQLAKRGKLPAGVKIGRSRRWGAQEVNDWLARERDTQ